MPHSETVAKISPRGAQRSRKNYQSKSESRFTVGLVPGVAHQVERYAETADLSMSKAIAVLVRLGLEDQENRKQEFFKKLKRNLTNRDTKQQDRLIDEFRALILGR